MGVGVLVFGKSGSGKSRSLKNFGAKEILYINVEKKMLPFRNNFEYCLESDNVDAIISKLSNMNKAGIKIAVVDDCGYLMTEYFMQNRRGLTGNKVYELYNEIADRMHKIFTVVKALPNDTTVYFMLHEDVNENGDIGLKTIGRLLDRTVCIEGMFTIVLRAMSEKGRHFFKTVTDGKDIVKTPEDMFEEEEIENDLKMVDNTIREFYKMNENNGGMKND